MPMPAKWEKIQKQLLGKLSIPSESDLDLIQCPYVVGLDISYIKGNQTNAVCTAVLLKYTDPTTLLDTETKEVQVVHQYIAGFLAFRELDSYILLFQNLMSRHLDKIDQIAFVMLDGNGILHPRGLGLASHFGVVTGFRTIGCGKTLHQFDGLDRKEIRIKMDVIGTNRIVLCGASGRSYGWAVRTSQNPVYISPGHKIGLQDSLTLSRPLMIYREPEPTRQADRISRAYIRTHGLDALW
jgi:deoxyinosine 3'endonuclease (endonuclease V)